MSAERELQSEESESIPDHNQGLSFGKERSERLFQAARKGRKAAFGMKTLLNHNLLLEKGTRG